MRDNGRSLNTFKRKLKIGVSFRTVTVTDTTRQYCGWCFFVILALFTRVQTYLLACLFTWYLLVYLLIQYTRIHNDTSKHKCAPLFAVCGWTETKIVKWFLWLVSWVRFNVPPNTWYVISGTGFYGSNDPTNSVKTLKEDRVLRIRLQCSIPSGLTRRVTIIQYERNTQNTNYTHKHKYIYAK